MMLKVDGVDDGPATALRQAIVAAGADYAGTVTVTDRLALATSADVGCSADHPGSGHPRPDGAADRCWPPGWPPW